MNNLSITEINIEPIENKGGLLGFASFILNGNFKICNVGIHSTPAHSTGIRLVFPEKEHNGYRLRTVYPINKASYEEIVVVVANAYQELMEKLR